MIVFIYFLHQNKKCTSHVATYALTSMILQLGPIKKQSLVAMHCKALDSSTMFKFSFYLHKSDSQKCDHLRTNKSDSSTRPNKKQSLVATESTKIKILI